MKMSCRWQSIILWCPSSLYRTFARKYASCSSFTVGSPHINDERAIQDCYRLERHCMSHELCSRSIVALLIAAHVSSPSSACLTSIPALERLIVAPDVRVSVVFTKWWKYQSRFVRINTFGPRSVQPKLRTIFQVLIPLSDDCFAWSTCVVDEIATVTCTRLWFPRSSTFISKLLRSVHWSYIEHPLRCVTYTVESFWIVSIHLSQDLYRVEFLGWW